MESLLAHVARKERERLRSIEERGEHPVAGQILVEGQPVPSGPERPAELGMAAQAAGVPSGQEAGSQSIGYDYATHDEPFMLPDADACSDPHSIPLARPFATGNNGNSQ